MSPAPQQQQCPDTQTHRKCRTFTWLKGCLPIITCAIQINFRRWHVTQCYLGTNVDWDGLIHCPAVFLRLSDVLMASFKLNRRFVQNKNSPASVNIYVTACFSVKVLPWRVWSLPSFYLWSQSWLWPWEFCHMAALTLEENPYILLLHHWVARPGQTARIYWQHTGS